jgi:hypothetical protein
MDMKKYSGQHFIKVGDVRDGPLQMQIAAIREGKYEKPEIVFESGDVLSLNATNNQALLRCFGSESKDSIGKEIELYLGEIEFQKQMQEAVRVRPISPPIEKPAKKPAPEMAPGMAPDMDDEIPF